MKTGITIRVSRGSFSGCGGLVTSYCKRTGAIIFKDSLDGNLKLVNEKDID